MFSKGDFELKLLGLFRSFDVDNGGSIDKNELITFFESAINGLCKLLDIALPNRNSILDFSYVVFKEIDSEDTGEIE